MLFNSEPVFVSSPLQVSVEPKGVQLVSRRALGVPGPGSVPVGPLESGILVTGRLQAGTLAQLLDEINTVNLTLEESSAPGQLVDDAGRVFDNVTFVRFEQTGPIVYGRVVSVPFRARFVGLIL